jgi:hypothetical protein
MREFERLQGDYNYVLNKKYAYPGTVQIIDDVTRLLPDDTWLSQLEMKTTLKGKDMQRDLFLRGESANGGKLLGLLEESRLVEQAALRSPTTKLQPGPGEVFDLGAQLRALAPPAREQIGGAPAPQAAGDAAPASGAAAGATPTPQGATAAPAAPSLAVSATSTAPPQSATAAPAAGRATPSPAETTSPVPATAPAVPPSTPAGSNLTPPAAPATPPAPAVPPAAPAVPPGQGQSRVGQPSGSRS